MTTSADPRINPSKWIFCLGTANSGFYEGAH
jgi:hypothetical protein